MTNTPNPVPAKPDGPLVQLAHVLEHVPQYLSEFVLGIIVAILTNPPITVLALGAASATVVFNVWAVLAVVAVVYVVIYAVNLLSGAVTNAGARVQEGLHTIASAKDSSPTDA
jgi:predicted PurR-regulated permease PerM